MNDCIVEVSFIWRFSCNEHTSLTRPVNLHQDLLIKKALRAMLLITPVFNVLSPASFLSNSTFLRKEEKRTSLSTISVASILSLNKRHFSWQLQ